MPRQPSSTEGLRVGYDRDIFLAQRRGGISRYFAELIGAFQQSPSFGVHPKLLFDRSNNAHLVEQCLGLRPSIPIPRFLIPATHRSHAARRVIYRLSGGRGGHASVDIVHFTYQFPLRRDLGRASKLAMTVMDLIPELEGSPRMDRRSGIRARLLREADLVFCISETTRQLLLEMYPWIEAITVTTPLGVDHSVFSEQAPSMLAPLDVPYVLYVGSRGGYKNFELLIEALANLRRSSSTLGLVVAGPPPTVGELATTRAALAGVPVVFVHPTDVELASLYVQALAFVFPSRREGFGLPVLEAMSCGCPALLADTPVFREVGGSGAQFFSLSNPIELELLLAQLISSPDDRSRIAKNGSEWVRQYSWWSTAEATSTAYKQVATG